MEAAPAGSYEGVTLRWRVLAVAIVGAVGVAAVVVSRGGWGEQAGRPPVGSALATGYVNWTTVGAPLPVGQQLVIIVAPLVNLSDSPVTVTRVRMLGSGVGTTIRVLEMKAVLTGTGRPVVPAGGEFHTDPPVIDFVQPAGCHRAVVRPLSGAVLAPDVAGEQLAPAQWVRVLVRFEAASPGKVKNTGYDVTYREGGQPYHQVIPEGWRLTVERGVPPQHIAAYERGCLHLSHLLPPFG